MSYGIRREFYNSKAWQDVRKTVWLRQNLLCNRCHKPVYVDGISEYIPKGQRRTGIVHHKIYLNETNINDKNITLNIDNLEGLCKDCHEQEHTKGQAIRNNYYFDEEGNLKIQGGISTTNPM